MPFDDLRLQTSPPLGRKSDRDASSSRPLGRKSRSAPSPALDRPSTEEDEILPLWSMKITQSVLRETMTYLLSREPEMAALLVGPTDDDLLVTHVIPDVTGRSTSVSFELGAEFLNDELKRLKPAKLNCKGIVHTHPIGIPAPSLGDLNYLRRLFALAANTDTAPFFMPIVCGGRLYPYVYAQGRVQRADLVLV